MAEAMTIEKLQQKIRDLRLQKFCA